MGGEIMDLMKRHTTKRTYSSLKDRELVHLFRKKADESAFNELLTRHQSKIYSYIYSMVNNPEVANDIFQETFTKVVTKMDDTKKQNSNNNITKRKIKLKKIIKLKASKK